MNASLIGRYSNRGHMIPMHTDPHTNLAAIIGLALCVALLVALIAAVVIVKPAKPEIDH